MSNRSISCNTTFFVYLATAIIFLLVCSLCAYRPTGPGFRRSILDDDNDDNDDEETAKTQQFRDACIPCIGPRMMLGWKGVKQHLPSKVAKAVPLLLSKKKREKHAADGSAKDQTGRYILLWMTGETGTSIKTEILH